MSYHDPNCIIIYYYCSILLHYITYICMYAIHVTLFASWSSVVGLQRNEIKEWNKSNIYFIGETKREKRRPRPISLSFHLFSWLSRKKINELFDETKRVFSLIALSWGGLRNNRHYYLSFLLEVKRKEYDIMVLLFVW